MLSHRLCSYLLLPLLSAPMLPAQALPTAPIQIAKRMTFEPPKGQPAPRQTIGGGRRDNGVCAGGDVAARRTPDQILTALVPSNNLGLTTDTHPTLFAYIPKTSAKSIEFLVENDKNEDVHQATIPLVTTPTVVRLTLPKTLPPLEVGKDYRWNVAINCPTSGPQDPFTGAWLRRIKLDSAVANRLSTAKQPLEQAAIYARAGVWHEALTILATTRQTNQTDRNSATAWKELLESVGLEAIAPAPLQK